VKVSKDYKYAADIFASNEAVLVTSRAKTKTWSASLSDFMAPDEMNLIQLDSEFEYSVSKLPVEYVFEDYLPFVEEGTHYVKRLVMGAKYSCRTFFDNATFASMKSEGMDIDVTAYESTWFHATSHSANIEKSSSVQQYDDNALGIQACTGHGPLPPSTDPNLWNEVVKTDSYPLEMELQPLTDILTPSFFPNDPDILVKATNFLRACTEYCEKTEKCYNPSPNPKEKWGNEYTATDGETVKLMQASEATCILTQVYRTTVEYCNLFISNLEPGDSNYYWYIQASTTSTTLCSARCSTEITWPLMNQLTNDDVIASARSYRLGHPYTEKGTFSMNLEPQATSFCFLTFVNNQVGCGDHGVVYPDASTGSWVLQYYTGNPWDSKHQDLNAADRNYGSICLNVTSTPNLLLEVEVNADQGIVPVMLVDDGVCIFEKIQGTGLCSQVGQGGGVHLKQEEVAGKEGTWWAFEGYSASYDDIRCVGTAHIKCYTY
jgi:hypothetical protein